MHTPGPIFVTGSTLPATDSSSVTELAAALRDASVKEVVVLPTASAFEDSTAALAASDALFSACDVRTIVCRVLTRTDANSEDFATVVRAANAVFLLDGSAMHARSVLTTSPVWDAVREAHQRGAVVVGSGAGAMVLGDPMLDPRGGAFMLGLGLVVNTTICPDIDSWSDERLRRTRKMAGARISLVELTSGELRRLSVP